MHELGVVFHIIDSLEEVAKENDVTQIQSVTIEIGEVSTVIPHYLTDCWEWAIKKKPMLTGCAMKGSGLVHEAQFPSQFRGLNCSS